MARLRVADEGTETSRSSGVDVESAQGPDAAAEQRNATKTALAVAATAAVELTNLFFLLRGDAECRCHRHRKTDRLTAVEELAVLSALAAFLGAAGLLLVLHVPAAPARRASATVVPAACGGRVVLLASAASLFVASAGTAVSLLQAPCLLRLGAALAD